MSNCKHDPSDYAIKLKGYCEKHSELSKVKSAIWVENDEVQATLECECKVQTYYLLVSSNLYDKNGKEIFEGDIIKEVFDKEHTNYFKVLNTGAEGFYLIGINSDIIEQLTNYSIDDIHRKFFDYYEVIGNQLSNPEMLEQLKNKD